MQMCLQAAKKLGYAVTEVPFFVGLRKARAMDSIIAIMKHVRRLLETGCKRWALNSFGLNATKSRKLGRWLLDDPSIWVYIEHDERYDGQIPSGAIHK